MSYGNFFKYIFVSLVLAFFVSLLALNFYLDTPFDRNETFKTAKSYDHPLRIGYSSKHCRNHKETFVSKTEYALMQEFVDLHNLQAQWKKVSLHEGVDLISQGKLHILLGCFSESNHYKELVFTRPFEEQRVIAVTKGENKLMIKLEKFLAEAKTGKPT